MKYFIEDPSDFENMIEVPKAIQKDIIVDYLKNTYYWTVGILCAMIGFLIGVAV